MERGSYLPPLSFAIVAHLTGYTVLLLFFLLPQEGHQNGKMVGFSVGVFVSAGCVLCKHFQGPWDDVVIQNIAAAPDAWTSFVLQNNQNKVLQSIAMRITI